MLEWLVVPGMIGLVVAAMVVGNVFLCFHIAMAGGGRPDRWYMLFFAAYEILTPILRRSFLARLGLIGSLTALLYLAFHFGEAYGEAAGMAFFIGIVVLFSGFFVPAWRHLGNSRREPWRSH